MSESHTPGPWEQTNSLRFLNQWGVGHDLYVAAIRDGDKCIAIVAHDGMGKDEAEANARLIAAAPELLQACKTFAEWLRRDDEGSGVGDLRDTPEGEAKWRVWWEEQLRLCSLAQSQAQTAIAKATGQAA